MFSYAIVDDGDTKHKREQIETDLISAHWLAIETQFVTGLVQLKLGLALRVRIHRRSLLKPARSAGDITTRERQRPSEAHSKRAPSSRLGFWKCHRATTDL